MSFVVTGRLANACKGRRAEGPKVGVDGQRRKRVIESVRSYVNFQVAPGLVGYARVVVVIVLVKCLRFI